MLVFALTPDFARSYRDCNVRRSPSNSIAKNTGKRRNKPEWGGGGGGGTRSIWEANSIRCGANWNGANSLRGETIAILGFNCFAARFLTNYSINFVQRRCRIPPTKQTFRPSICVLNLACRVGETRSFSRVANVKAIKFGSTAYCMSNLLSLLRGQNCLCPNNTASCSG